MGYVLLFGDNRLALGCKTENEAMSFAKKFTEETGEEAIVYKKLCTMQIKKPEIIVNFGGDND